MYCRRADDQTFRRAMAGSQRRPPIRRPLLMSRCPSGRTTGRAAEQTAAASKTSFITCPPIRSPRCGRHRGSSGNSPWPRAPAGADARSRVPGGRPGPAIAPVTTDGERCYPTRQCPYLLPEATPPRLSAVIDYQRVKDSPSSRAPGNPCRGRGRRGNNRDKREGSGIRTSRSTNMLAMIDDASTRSTPHHAATWSGGSMESSPARRAAARHRHAEADSRA